MANCQYRRMRRGHRLWRATIVLIQFCPTIQRGVVRFGLVDAKVDYTARSVFHAEKTGQPLSLSSF
jgi:hypothetical protein